MKRILSGFVWLALILEILVYYWFQLPAFNFLSLEFWFFILQSFGLLWIVLAITSKISPIRKVTKVSGRNRQVESYQFSSGKLPTYLSWLGRVWVVFVLLIIVLGVINSHIFRAKDYASVVTVEEADFQTDCPETDISKLAL